MGTSGGAGEAGEIPARQPSKIPVEIALKARKLFLSQIEVFPLRVYIGLGCFIDVPRSRTSVGSVRAQRAAGEKWNEFKLGSPNK